MVKFEDLKSDQLKKELSKMGLRTAGTMAEMQQRLREALAEHGKHIAEMDFGKTAKESEESSASQEMKLLMQMMQQNFTCIEQNSAEQFAIIKQSNAEIKKSNAQSEQSNIQNFKLISDQFARIEHNSAEQFEKNAWNFKLIGERVAQSESSSAKNFDLIGEQYEMIKKSNAQQFAENERKLDDISTALRTSVQELAEWKSRLERDLSDIKTRIENLDISRQIESKFQALEQRAQSSSVGITTTTALRIKAPIFDGTTPFNTFQFQFETAIAHDRSNNDEAVTAFIVFLQMIPLADRKNYEAIMEALGRRYGSDHMVQVHRTKLLNRSQHAGEGIQEFAADIERLAYLTYPNESGELFERLKIEAFANGIRNADTKMEVL